MVTTLTNKKRILKLLNELYSNNLAIEFIKYEEK